MPSLVIRCRWVELGDGEELVEDGLSVFSPYVERCKMDGEEERKVGNPPPFILVDNRAGDRIHGPRAIRNHPMSQSYLVMDRLSTG